ncbi:tetratricopeptide repeat protein [Spirosoma fluviale]|uniref:Tetratricopeptide repeat-containing protein n=1 Tax=Spirosoma fluviale TaxID=1597977 RepID=A0A286G571_9BACT|nr:tetratricopeptide repeat protein [Spirosoma fluviale]SOD90681.1 hypothetical protein SAMN06269250_3504 [Spirosoma fluviale]
MKRVIASTLWIVFLLVACTAKKPAQTAEGPTQVPLCTGNVSVEADYIATLPPPQWITNVGNSQMRITTTSKEAQRWFNQGLNLLHDFMYFEAYRAFVQASKQDSTCAMSYWGMVMALPGTRTEALRQRQTALNKALRLPASPKEKQFIQTAQSLADNGLQASLPLFRKLYQTYPDDPEAIAFAAIMLRFGSDSDWAESRTITETALRQFPTHTGLMHYYIHIMELSPAFAEAIPYATTLSQLAGGVSHTVHMPGHLYFLQGQYQKAASVFEQAHKQDETYHKSQKIPYLNNDNYLHNLHYWAVALAETGNQKKALEVANLYAGVTTDPERSQSSGMLMIMYEGQVMPALVYMRFGQWQEAVDYLAARPFTNATARQFQEGLRAYCLAMLQLSESQPTGIDAQLDILENARQVLYTRQQQLNQSPEQERVKRAQEILTIAQAELAGWISNIDPAKPLDQTAFFQALRLEKSIGYQEPPRLVCPVFEHIGDFFLRRRDGGNALQVLEKALQKRPNSPVILDKIRIARQL